MFKKIICDLLKLNGMTQTQLAKQAGIPLTTISGWINANRLPDYNAIKKLAQFFDVTTDYLLGLSDEWGNATDIQKTPTSLPADAQNILDLYNSLSPERQREAAVWLKTLNELDSQKGNVKKSS